MGTVSDVFILSIDCIFIEVSILGDIRGAIKGNGGNPDRATPRE